MPIPSEAQLVLDRYQQLIAEKFPDLADSMYLTGSIAQGAYRPGRSDIDLTVLLARPPSETEFDGLAQIHGALPKTPFLDGVYLSRAQLLRSAEAEPQMILFTEGRVERTGFDRLPIVLWVELSRHAIILRGSAPQQLGVTVGADELSTWLRDNLTGYWADLAAKNRQALSGREPASEVPAEGLVWAVSGPPRLHCTLRTGTIISKQAALDYARDRFGAYADLCDRCRAWRDGDDSVKFTVEDVYTGMALVAEVIADATGKRES